MVVVVTAPATRLHAEIGRADLWVEDKLGPILRDWLVWWTAVLAVNMLYVGDITESFFTDWGTSASLS